MLAPDLIELSNDKSSVEFKITPSNHGPIAEDSILTLLSLPEFSQYFPLENIIQKAVIDVNKVANQEDGQYELFFKVAEQRDGLITLDITEDKMSATMTLTAAWAGEQPSIQSVLKALKSQNISMGLSKIKIQTLLKQLSELSPGQSCSAVIANGKLAKNGINAKLERKVSLARERLLQPQKREDGSVDMRNLGAIIMVKPSDLLMVKHLATKGSEGYDIHGTILTPVEGKDLELKAGDGTELSPNNNNHLVASVAGQPVETKSGMQVDDVLNIKDVDVGYGNVDFKGSVLITGDVHEGMSVKSSGDITVMGFVDSATL